MAKKVYLKGEEFVFSRVKGNKESTYRDGDINLTPANIGASAEGHTHDDRYYTESEINTKLNSKANSSHTHGNGDITSLDAGKITSGTISVDRLPQGALERLTVVADDTARFKLTSATVQKGDTVKVTSSGKMYYIVDETKLSSEAGYEVYAAGTAASVPWSGVTGKPSTYTPSSHTHTKSQISDFPTSMPASDVPAWAKTSTKPTYTKAEVGLGNVDNTADLDKTVYRANGLTIHNNLVGGSTTNGTVEFMPDALYSDSTYYPVSYDPIHHIMSYNKDADTSEAIVNFTSGDSSTGDSTAPAVITSGETHKSLFNKISTAVKNVRWLLSKIGTTDISSIGNGTVTGALSTLNSNIADIKGKYIVGSFVVKANETATTPTISSNYNGLRLYYYDGNNGLRQSVIIPITQCKIPYMTTNGIKYVNMHVNANRSLTFKNDNDINLVVTHIYAIIITQ